MSDQCPRDSIAVYERYPGLINGFLKTIQVHAQKHQLPGAIWQVNFRFAFITAEIRRVQTWAAGMVKNSNPVLATYQGKKLARHRNQRAALLKDRILQIFKKKPAQKSYITLTIRGLGQTWGIHLNTPHTVSPRVTGLWAVETSGCLRCQAHTSS